MNEYTFTIPCTRDTDKEPHLAAAWKVFGQYLTGNFGGYTRHPAKVFGVWADDDGNYVHDRSERWAVCCPLRGRDEIVALIKRLFDQRAVYVSEGRAEIL